MNHANRPGSWVARTFGLVCIVLMGGAPTWGVEPPDASAGNMIVSQRLPIANGFMVVCRKRHTLRDAADLMIHFHGDPATVARAFQRCDLDCVLAIVNFPGLSSAYAQPFADDSKQFEIILERARQESQAGGRRGIEPWGRITLSSFSAGYGAVREIIKQPKFFDRIGAVVAADSIYAGLGPGDARHVNKSNMHDFLRFATLAADSKKDFVLSHSAQTTPYASTTETADYLLGQLHLERTREVAARADGMHQQTAARHGHLEVLGFAGTSAADHMRHLHHIDLLWNQLSSVRPRLVILADMGNEPDEEQQMVHMLVCSATFELQGLIAVTGKFLNENAARPYKRVVHPELFHKLIDGYQHVEAHLRQHALGWPTTDYLHSIVCCGQRKYGIADVGDGKSTAGSQLIVLRLLEDDARPLNVVVNAGSNTLAQALVDLRSTRTPQEVQRLVAKLRVFENGAQDNAGAWICHEFPGIHWIRSNHQTYGYMGQASNGSKPAGPYCWQPYPRTHQGQHRWAERHIMRDHGALGALYPYRFDGRGFLEGGGTIGWMGLVNRGLYDVDHPAWGGWSGRFTRVKQRNVWSRHASVRADEEKHGEFFAYTEAPDCWIDPRDGTTYNDEFAPVWRWRQAMLNDCQTRFDWCITSYDQANHHPIAAVNGDASNAILRYDVKPGSMLRFEASDSCDPDGDQLSYRWYFYPEAGTYRGALTTSAGDRAVYQAAIPADAAGTSIHLILEVTDNNASVSLTDYRRVVIDVGP